MPDRHPPLAIVTGAGSGLGRAFCRRLAAMPGGCHLVLVDINEPSARETLGCIEHLAGVSGECAAFDVSDPDAWNDLRERLRRDWPRLDLLVNNAGICMSAEVGDATLASWRRIHEVNYLGVLNGCHTMAAWLKQSADNRITGNSPFAKPAVINVASIMGLLSTPSIAAYCASKAAVVALSEAMYAELRPHGVNVTVAAPGFFASSLLDNGQYAEQCHRDQAEALVRTSRIDADLVARETLKASARGKLYAVTGSRARWFWRLKRLAPTVASKLLAQRYRRMMIDQAKPGRAPD
jgi:NAD(P)-dependent dehydrogenase (short-subunit alcohol dehydrogenase family)